MIKNLVDNQKNDEFFNLFKKNIYHSKFIVKTNNDWITIPAYLKQSKIEDAYLSKAKNKIGFFSCFQTKMLCIDIDAHNVEDDHIEYVSYSKLERVNSLLGIEPSAVEKTRHGLHCFYFLSDFINITHFSEQLAYLFRQSKIDVEIKGTNSLGLSLPIKKNIIVYDLQPLNISIFTSLFYYKSKLKKSITMPTIYNGTSNDVLCKTVPYLKYSCGYNNPQIADLLSSKFDSSYTGELTNRYRLLKRIDSFKSSTKILIKKKVIEHNSTHEVMRLISEKATVSPREYVSLKLLVNELLKLKESFEENCSSNENLYYLNSKYTFTKYYHKMNATPVPSSLLTKINSHYNKYLKILKDIGFLTFPNGRHYSVNGHTCIHYIIGFVKEVSTDIQSYISNIIDSINNISYPSKSIIVLNCLSDTNHIGIEKEKLIYYIDKSS